MTVYDGTAAGGVTVYDPDDPQPPAGQLSVSGATGVRATNGVVTTLSEDGTIVVRNSAAGSRDVYVDVLGWWAPSSVAGGSVYLPLAASEVIDTTQGKGIAGQHGGRCDLHRDPRRQGRGALDRRHGRRPAGHGDQADRANRAGGLGRRAGQAGPALGQPPRRGSTTPCRSSRRSPEARLAMTNLKGTAGLRAYAVGYWYQP